MCMHYMILQFAQMIASFGGSDNYNCDDVDGGSSGGGSDDYGTLALMVVQSTKKKPRELRRKSNHNYKTRSEDYRAKALEKQWTKSTKPE